MSQWINEWTSGSPGIHGIIPQTKEKLSKNSSYVGLGSPRSSHWDKDSSASDRSLTGNLCSLKIPLLLFKRTPILYVSKLLSGWNRYCKPHAKANIGPPLEAYEVLILSSVYFSGIAGAMLMANRHECGTTLRWDVSVHSMLTLILLHFSSLVQSSS